MRFHTVHLPPSERIQQDTFGGYNHNLRIPETDFYDEINLTSDRFPVLSPRDRRGIYKADGTVSGMVSQYGQLCYISDDRYFHAGDRKIDFGEGALSHHDQRQLIPMGRDIVVLPDMIFIQERDGALSWGQMRRSKTAVNSDGVPTTCATMPIEKSGMTRTIRFTGQSDPQSPAEGDFWAKKDGKTSDIVLYRYNGQRWIETESWYELSFTTASVVPAGQLGELKDGDTIRVKITAKKLYLDSGEEADPEILEKLNGAVGTYVEYSPGYYGGFFCRIPGFLTAENVKLHTLIEDGVLSIERDVPILDYACVSGNRLWGCRYGPSGTGDAVNEIRASAQGDYLQWGTFEGVGSDSYAVNVGSDGPFTAAVAYRGSTWFFKEHIVHRVAGSLPRNYQVADTVLRGVQQGSAGSVAIINEMLYYKSPEAVCVFDGSLPVKISDQLGDTRYRNAVGGGFDRKYYISMQAPDGSYQAFDYDVERGIWHRQDDGAISDYCAHGGEMYFANSGGIYTMLGSGTLDQEPVEWYAESGAIGVTLPDHKYLTRLNIRMRVPPGSEVRAMVRYDDDDGDWHLVYTEIGSDLDGKDIPIRPRRCDHFRLRLEGTGPCTIYAMNKTIRLGSDHR